LGSWRICYGGHEIFTDAPSDTIGVEFAPLTSGATADIEGDMYLLRQGPLGPVRGPGSDYQQTYIIGGGVVYCHSKLAGYAIGLKYSPCPREWWFENDATNHAGPLASF
jgi:hypothetical protein